MKRFAAIAAAAVLGGCSTTQPGPSGAELMAADPSNPCFERINTQFSTGPLANKISFGPPPTLEMVLDKTTPSGEEKAALRQYSAARQQCIEVGRAYRAKSLPAAVAVALDDGGKATTMLMAKLYAGELTYGKFNIARDENSGRIRSKLLDYDRQANQAQTQAAANESARRQSAANALLQTQQSLQLQQQASPAPTYQIVQPPALRTPTTTNCQRWGNQVNCTTY